MGLRIGLGHGPDRVPAAFDQHFDGGRHMLRPAERRGRLQHDHDVVANVVDAFHFGKRVRQHFKVADVIAGQLRRAAERRGQARRLGSMRDVVVVGGHDGAVDHRNPGDDMACARHQRHTQNLAQVLERHAFAAAPRRDHGEDASIADQLQTLSRVKSLLGPNINQAFTLLITHIESLQEVKAVRTPKQTNPIDRE